MKIAAAVMGCVLVATSVASGEVIRGINMDFVTIGNAGNVPDTGGTPGCGAVGYNYRIGKFEVTNAQWNAFTSAAGAPTGTTGGYSLGSWYTGAQQPANRVGWYEAAQFCNYLTSGDKSKGVYQFSGNNANPGIFLGVHREAAKPAYGAIYFMPTEDEWYKAAYLKPNGSGYSLYANGTNTAPTMSQSCYGISSPWNVGSGMVEQNGTFDMMGSMFEWTETVYSSPAHYFRGGSYPNGFEILRSSSRYQGEPTIEYANIGFRIATIPEPATLMLLGLGGMAVAAKRRRSEK